MPELPEVETVRRGLADLVTGRRVHAVQVLHARAVRRQLAGADDFAAGLVGTTLHTPHRRGKYLWFPLDPAGDALLAHLGMSGQFRVYDEPVADEPHLRVRLRLDGDRELRFVDQRTFGGLVLSRGGAHLPAEIAHIARDPLDPAFDDAAFTAALRRRRTGLKRALLDQSLISGVGNIYADEALWLARLHYARPTETLTRAQVADVLAAVRAVMSAAMVAGGTSFDALYVDVNGASGYFDVSLRAYGQRDRPCARCGTPIRREAFMNRSSYFCPHCQRRPRRPR